MTHPKIFENWQDAQKYQRAKLEEYLRQGLAIRACEINIGTDFTSGKTLYSVFARPFSGTLSGNP